MNVLARSYEMMIPSCTRFDEFVIHASRRLTVWQQLGDRGALSRRNSSGTGQGEMWQGRAAGRERLRNTGTPTMAMPEGLPCPR
jgi:hypothetical protein